MRDGFGSLPIARLKEAPFFERRVQDAKVIRTDGLLESIDRAVQAWLRMALDLDGGLRTSTVDRTRTRNSDRLDSRDFAQARL